jgi:hypothetical protein
MKKMKKLLFAALLSLYAFNLQGQNSKESFLETIENSYQSSPNTASLAKYIIKSKENLNNINNSTRSLRWIVVNNNKRSRKMKHSIVIKKNAELLLRNCSMAKKYIEKIINYVKINSEQKQKIEYLRGKLNSISYTAKYLIETCNFVIDKPRKLTVKKYNTMAKSNELLFKNFNKLLSKRQFLLYVAIIEKSNN